MKALEKLTSANDANKFICVGLDTDIEKIPSFLKSSSRPTLDFNKAIIDAVEKNAAAFKINFAFYESAGYDGIKILSETIDYIPDDILIIGDAKRGDIGNTSKMYAKSVFDHFKCDAVTLNPFMGYDSLEPFLLYEDKLNFILALTSNTGASDFEKQKLDNGTYLYQKIIQKVNEWNTRKNCGIVFGATKNDELKENMNNIGSLPVLLPGIGTQSGNLEEVISSFKTMHRKQLLINVSRNLIYKSSGKDFTLKVKEELVRLNSEVIKLFET